MTRIALEPYFLHRDQVQSLLGEQRTESARARVDRRSDPEAALSYVLAAELAEALSALGVGELARRVLERNLRAGQVVGTELEFAFQRDRDRDAPGFKPASFTAVLDAGEPVRVTGTFNAARIASSSAFGSLTGTRRVYLIGTVTNQRDRLLPLPSPMKRAFAGLIGESYVPKDWGGERSDLHVTGVRPQAPGVGRVAVQGTGLPSRDGWQGPG